MTCFFVVIAGHYCHAEGLNSQVGCLSYLVHSLLACKQTAKAAAQWKEEVMLPQMNLKILKYVRACVHKDRHARSCVKLRI